VRLEGRLALIVARELPPPSASEGARTLVVETDERAAVVATLLRSQLQPSALDVLHPGRVAVLFEGSERAVEAQLRRRGARRRDRGRMRRCGDESAGNASRPRWGVYASRRGEARRTS
jgi:hypothetical protein